jgi:hypothetical protein
VEVVVGEQLGPAEGEHIWLDTPSLQLFPQPASPLLGLRDSRRCRATTELPVLAELQAVEGQRDVHLRPPLVEYRLLAAVAGGGKGVADEGQHAVAGAVAVLPGREGIEQPLPLGERGVEVVDPDLAQRLADLGARQAGGRVRERLAEGLQFGRREWLRSLPGRH